MIIIIIIIIIIIMVFQMGSLHCLTKRQHPNNAEFSAWLSTHPWVENWPKSVVNLAHYIKLSVGLRI
jgi:flagellar basal body-associated protein FliL